MTTPVISNDAELRDSAAGIDPALAASIKRIVAVEVARHHGKADHSSADEQAAMDVILTACWVVIATSAVICLLLFAMQSFKSDLRDDLMLLRDDIKEVRDDNRVLQAELEDEIGETEKRLLDKIPLR